MKDIIEELGLEGAKLAGTPMVVSQSSKKDSDSRALSMRDATLYRRLVAKLSFLAMDRPDIRYAASTTGSQASSPKDAEMVRLKRVERFLIGRPITWTHYRWEVRSDRIMAYTDSDWAANREDRRSVSGGKAPQEGSTATSPLGSHGPGSSDDSRHTRRRLDTFTSPEDEHARSAVFLRFPCEQYHTGVMNWINNLREESNTPACNKLAIVHCKAGSESARLVFETRAKCQDFGSV